MNRRVLILLLLIVVVIVIGAAVFLSQGGGGGATPAPGGGGVAQQPTPLTTSVPLTQIVVAIQELPRGIKIPLEGAVDLRPWPVNAVPARAITDPRQVVGKIARTDIAREEPIVDTLLVDDLKDIAKSGSDAAAVIPSGLRMISIPMDRLTGLAYGVQDGDYVDVIVSFLFVDVDPNFQSKKPNKLTIVHVATDGTITLQPAIEGELVPSQFGANTFLVSSPNEEQRPRLLTQTTVQAAYVIHVGTFPLDGHFINRPAPPPTPTQAEGAPTPQQQQPTPTPPFPDIISLAVSPQDAVVLAWAIEARIPITLTLRNVRDTQPAQTTSVTLQYMIENYNIAQPPALPYALEPALRSIRRLIIGNEISLNPSGSTPGK